MQAFKSIIVSLDHDNFSLLINRGKAHNTLIELRFELEVKGTDFCAVAIILRHGQGELSLADRVFDRAQNIKAQQLDPWLQVKSQAKRSHILHIVLLVVACNELQIIQLLLWHRVRSTASNLDVGLSLFRALH